jgi:hypothetical protein
MFMETTELEVPLAKPLPMVASNFYVRQLNNVNGYKQFPILHAVQCTTNKCVVYRDKGGERQIQKINIQKAR